jgi:glycosyltransferase involved in cell wall biosynthesis
LEFFDFSKVVHKVDGLKLSVVLPVFNEEECITEVLQELIDVLSSENFTEFEIIPVDDGSTDKTFERIIQLARDNEKIKPIQLTRNFGQSAAMACGFDNAQFDLIVAMDSDGQNNPRDIPKLIAKLKEGFDCVSGWRKNRKDKNLSRKIPSNLANRMISSWTKVKLHDYGCTLKAYKKSSITGFPIYGEIHRFLPAYASLQGATISEIEVDHRERRTGKSKYGIGRTYRVVLDILVARAQAQFAMRPMHLLGGAGLIFSFFGLAMIFASIVMKIYGISDFVDTPLPTVGGFLTVFGMQMVLIGLLAEFQLRLVMREGKLKPYIIKH